MLKQKKYQQALAHFNEAIKAKVKSNNLGLVFIHNKALSLLKQKKYNQAIEHFDKIIKLHSQYKVSWIDKTFYNKGVALVRLKKYQQALIEFNNTIRYNVQNSNVHDMKIDSLMLLNQCQKAKEASRFAEKNKIKLQQAVLQKLKSRCDK